MHRIFKVITLPACAVLTNVALADQAAQSAMNQNGSSEAVARLRYSWKNGGAKPFAASQRSHLARTKGKARSLITQATPAMG